MCQSANVLILPAPALFLRSRSVSPLPFCFSALSAAADCFCSLFSVHCALVTNNYVTHLPARKRNILCGNV